MPCKWWRRILLSIYSRSIQTKRKLFQLVQGSRTPSFFCLVVVERWGNERIHVIYLYEDPAKSDCICSNSFWLLQYESIWVSGEPATISHFLSLLPDSLHILDMRDTFSTFLIILHHFPHSNIIILNSIHLGGRPQIYTFWNHDEKKTFDSIHGHCIDHISKTKHHKLTEATQHFPFPQLNWCAIDVGLK